VGVKTTKAVDILERTVSQIVTKIASKNAELNATKDTVLERIAWNKVTEVFNLLKKGKLITAHDIEICTTAVYKEAIYEIAFNDSPNITVKPQSAKHSLQ